MTTLPVPDVASEAHSKKVADFVRDKIVAAGGYISFAEYMQHTLYAPGLGYYNSGTTKFGMAGDFVTAPEVSTLFGQVLARQCADVLRQTDNGELLEVGAGSGKLAADMLRSLAALNALPQHYKILEVSADLQERQRRLLEQEIPELIDRVEWLVRLPDDHSGVIVANELLDALPVERFACRDDGLMQVVVVVDGNGFALDEKPAPPQLRNAIAAIEQYLGRPLAEGFVSEISFSASAWVADVARRLRSGAVFLFDYGVNRRDYYAKNRVSGWLQCHFRHHAHSDAMIFPGIQDLTAWVDFTAIAETAAAHGLDIIGFVSQAHFMINGGLSELLQDIAELPPVAQIELSSQAKLLTLPDEMGEKFKCLGLRRGTIVTPNAFVAGDRTADL